MAIRHLVLSAVLSLSAASPAVLADEMGTGTPEPTSNSSSTAATAPATAPAVETEGLCSLWETFLGWFE